MAYAQYRQGGIGEMRETHFHAGYEMIFMQTGWAEMEIGRRSYHADAPCVVFLGALEEHRVKEASADYARCILTLPVDEFSGIPAELLSIFRSRPTDFCHVLPLKDCRADVDWYFRKALCESELGDAYAQEAVVHCVHLLLMELIRYAPGHFPAKKHHIPPQLVEMQLYLDAHCCERISITQVAARFYMSPATARRLFLEFVGCSPKRYVMLNRLYHARVMLEAEGAHLYDAALACGFSDSSHLIRCYKACYGCTPRGAKSET